MSLEIIIINTILTLLLPIFIGVVCWLYRLSVQRMPEMQALRLEQFSRMATRKVIYAHKDNPDKKTLATSYTALLFEYYRLPCPSASILDIAVDAAFYEIEIGRG